MSNNNQSGQCTGLALALGLVLVLFVAACFTCATVLPK